MDNRSEFETLAFREPAELQEWLDSNHRSSPGFLLKIGKGAFAGETVSYAQALELALIYGWIDSQKLLLDSGYWLQKFGPRKKNSIWSRRNREAAERLMAEGKMKASGLAAIEAAKANGEWDKAYEGQAVMEVPEDFLEALNRDPETGQPPQVAGARSLPASGIS
jgi:uncharacterized protein YdeI (YjbR/CyaY-like superfamily)